MLIDLVTLLQATVSLNINPVERGSKCSTTPPPKINTPRVSEADLITPTKTLSLFTLNGFSARPEHVGRPAPNGRHLPPPPHTQTHGVKL